MKRHPFDALSFAFGAVFAVAAALLGSDRLDVSDLGGTSVGPIAVIALGAILLVAAVVGARSDRAAAAHASSGSEGQTAEEAGPEEQTLDETTERN